MLLSAVSVLVVAQSSSEIPEGLMNNSVFRVVQCMSLCDLRVARTITFGGGSNLYYELLLVIER